MIETDLIVALASEADRHHDEAKRLLEMLASARLSPYSLVELDLLVSSRSLVVKVPDFYEALESVLAYYGISVLAPSPSHFARAWILRREYGLGFFDSLHAAAALESGEILVSFDRTYSKVRGLRYEHPSSLLR